MKIILGCDEAALHLKNKVRDYLISLGIETTDIGVYDSNPVLYPRIAQTLCKQIVDGSHERGILMCGTGIGMAISANKIQGIRAAVGHDIYSVQRSILSNDCQVLCFGARVVSFEYVQVMLKEWLELTFDNPNSKKKIDVIDELDQLRRERNNDKSSK